MSGKVWNDVMSATLESAQGEEFSAEDMMTIRAAMDDQDFRHVQSLSNEGKQKVLPIFQEYRKMFPEGNVVQPPQMKLDNTPAGGRAVIDESPRFEATDTSRAFDKGQAASHEQLMKIRMMHENTAEPGSYGVMDSIGDMYTHAGASDSQAAKNALEGVPGNYVEIGESRGFIDELNPLTYNRKEWFVSPDPTNPGEYMTYRISDLDRPIPGDLEGAMGGALRARAQMLGGGAALNLGKKVGAAAVNKFAPSMMPHLQKVGAKLGMTKSLDDQGWITNWLNPARKENYQAILMGLTTDNAIDKANDVVIAMVNDGATLDAIERLFDSEDYLYSALFSGTGAHVTGSAMETFKRGVHAATDFHNERIRSRARTPDKYGDDFAANMDDAHFYNLAYGNRENYMKMNENLANNYETRVRLLKSLGMDEKKVSELATMPDMFATAAQGKELFKQIDPRSNVDALSNLLSNSELLGSPEFKLAFMNEYNSSSKEVRRAWDYAFERLFGDVGEGSIQKLGTRVVDAWKKGRDSFLKPLQAEYDDLFARTNGLISKHALEISQGKVTVADDIFTIEPLVDQLKQELISLRQSYAGTKKNPIHVRRLEEMIDRMENTELERKAYQKAADHNATVPEGINPITKIPYKGGKVGVDPRVKYQHDSFKLLHEYASEYSKIASRVTDRKEQAIAMRAAGHLKENLLEGLRKHISPEEAKYFENLNKRYARKLNLLEELDSTDSAVGMLMHHIEKNSGDIGQAARYMTWNHEFLDMWYGGMRKTSSNDQRRLKKLLDMAMTPENRKKFNQEMSRQRFIQAFEQYGLGEFDNTKSLQKGPDGQVGMQPRDRKPELAERDGNFTTKFADAAKDEKFQGMIFEAMEHASPVDKAIMSDLIAISQTHGETSPYGTRQKMASRDSEGRAGTTGEALATGGEAGLGNVGSPTFATRVANFLVKRKEPKVTQALASLILATPEEKQKYFTSVRGKGPKSAGFLERVNQWWDGVKNEKAGWLAPFSAVPEPSFQKFVDLAATGKLSNDARERWNKDRDEYPDLRNTYHLIEQGGRPAFQSPRGTFSGAVRPGQAQ